MVHGIMCGPTFYIIMKSSVKEVYNVMGRYAGDVSLLVLPACNGIEQAISIKFLVVILQSNLL